MTILTAPTPSPDLLPTAKLTTALAEHLRFAGELRAAQDKARKLEAARAAAVTADAQALADAKRAGKKDPGQKHTTKADGEILAARREVDALQLATGDTAREFLAVLDAECDTAVATVDEQATAMLGRLVEQLEGVRRTYSELAQARGVQRWIAQPDRPFTVTLGWTVKSVLRQSGEAYAVGGLIEALHAEVAERAEVTSRPTRPSLVVDRAA